MATIINGDSISFSDLTTQKSAANQVVGFKNKIIGGDFTTNPWQRGTSFAAIASDAYFADRFRTGSITTAVVTASRVVDAPTATQAGIFTQHCISLAVTTTDTVVDAGDLYMIQQGVEGLNSASFGFGQAGSRNVTLSFWVKGTKTGIHCVAISNAIANRSYVAEYTIVTTNTWEYKTITISVDTTGTWLYDNGIGLRISFALMSGTTYKTTANTWAAGNFFATANQVNALDTVGNTFKIALVQLEAGSVATPFDVRSVGQELALCQRYFERLGNASYAIIGVGRQQSTTISQFYVKYNTTMRALPTFAISNLIATDRTGFDTAVTAVSSDGVGLDSAYLNITNVAAGNTGAVVFLMAASGTTGFLQLTAEL